ncbi:MAG: ATPase, T2SS/T4P/T4SS family, partial [Gaiellaceae bacterium]|nr:ATPase, T2SS/T4P/T4SS family [Gaiellaceae bacterium]
MRDASAAASLSTTTPADPAPHAPGQPFAALGATDTTDLVLEILERTELLAEGELARLRARTSDGASVTQALVEEELAPVEGVARMLAVRHHLPLVDLPSVGVQLDAAQAIPLPTLERARAVPYALEENVLRVAVADPGDLHAIDALRLATRHQLELGVASREDIAAELRRLARAVEATVVALDEEGPEEGDDLEVDDGISDGPLVRLVNALVFQAAEENASDVHFEPQEDALVVRFRVDGVLREVQRIPKRMASGVTTRLKVLAKLDIAERRKPQDGRISL